MAVPTSRLFVLTLPPVLAKGTYCFYNLRCGRSLVSEKLPGKHSGFYNLPTTTNKPELNLKTHKPTKRREVRGAGPWRVGFKRHDSRYGRCYFHALEEDARTPAQSQACSGPGGKGRQAAGAEWGSR